jgi:Flp pilus assembly protein TadB
MNLAMAAAVSLLDHKVVRAWSVSAVQLMGASSGCGCLRNAAAHALSKGFQMIEDGFDVIGRALKAGEGCFQVFTIFAR